MAKRKKKSDRFIMKRTDSTPRGDDARSGKKMNDIISKSLEKSMDDRMKEMSQGMQKTLEHVRDVHLKSIDGVKSAALDSFRSSLVWSERVSFDIKQTAANNIRCYPSKVDKKRTGTS
jgi:hypothetical protein